MQRALPTARTPYMHRVMSWTASCKMPVKGLAGDRLPALRHGRLYQAGNTRLHLTPTVPIVVAEQGM